MKPMHALELSLTTRPGNTLFADLLSLGIAQQGPDGPVTRPPDRGRAIGEGAYWEHRYVPGEYYWGGFVSWDGRDCAKVANTHFPYDVPYVLDLLRGLDFTHSATHSAVDGWWRKAHPYPRPWIGFSDGHFGHGWLCAFSGADGHARLVSRRWLDHGPWRVIRDEERDLTLVRFHDLEADEGTALAQAHPGHVRMGISGQGGFIQSHFVWTGFQATSYHPASRTLNLFVEGRDVTPFEMPQAAAVKRYQPHEGRPVDRVVYTFLREAEARRHLHELWLHGLEVRYTSSGPGERFRRIDDSYEPPPYELPDWVERVRDREGS